MSIVGDIKDKRLLVSRQVWKELLENIRPARPHEVDPVEKVVDQEENPNPLMLELKLCNE